MIEYSFITKGEYWGKERAVVVTHNPATARKQYFALDSKVEDIRQELLSMRSRVRDKMPHWRDPEAIKERYLRLCEHLHVSSDLHEIEFSQPGGKLSMSFRKNVLRVERKRAMFGKNIIITDNADWTTSEIVEASLDRWQVEDQFRLSKDDDIQHASSSALDDSKIRCHLFACNGGDDLSPTH